MCTCGVSSVLSPCVLGGIIFLVKIMLCVKMVFSGVMLGRLIHEVVLSTCLKVL